MLTVHQNPLHRLFTRAALRVDTAGGHTEQQVRSQRQWLAPIVRLDALSALIVAALVSLVFVALLGWWTVAAVAALAAWTVVATKRHVASLRWAISDNAVAFRSGWLWSFLTVAPLAKIQAVSLHQSPFDRRYGMASVLVDTAGGHDAPHRVSIPYLPHEVARSLCDRLVATTATTAFRW